MGSWDPGLFSDDLACDVRDDYRALIEDELDDDAATRQILTSHAELIDDPDDGPVVWLALAVTQSRIGRLDPAVAQRALSVISSGEGLARWSERGPRPRQAAGPRSIRPASSSPARSRPGGGWPGPGGTSPASSQAPCRRTARAAAIS